MSALNDFVVAAGSYFGLPEDRVVSGSTLDVSQGQMTLVLCIDLTTDDVVGIAKRAGVMTLEAQVDAAQAAKDVAVAAPLSRDQLRAMYNGLPAHQRSAFGSFAKYVATYRQADPYADDKAAIEATLNKGQIPAHVWIDPHELTSTQAAMAIGMDPTTGTYAMDPADLTQEQRTRLGIVLVEGLP